MTKISNQYSLTNILTADLANSRLGINNVSPAYSLDVTGTARVSGAATFSSSVSALSLDVISSSGVGSSTASGLARFITAGTTAGVSVGQSNSGRRLDLLSYGLSITGTDAYITNTGANATIFENNGAERMRITSAGNIAIGLSSTPDRLSVQGIANNWTGKFVGSSVTANSFGVDIVAGTNDGDYPLYVRTTNFSLRLFVRGDGVCYIGASSWVYNSDLRVKENIRNVINGLDLVNKLKPKHFDYIDGIKNNLGFIAQEVQELIPQAVTISDEKTGMLGLKTDFIIPYLTKAIQELSAENTSLINRIEALENK